MAEIMKFLKYYTKSCLGTCGAIVIYSNVFKHSYIVSSDVDYIGYILCDYDCTLIIIHKKTLKCLENTTKVPLGIFSLYC